MPLDKTFTYDTINTIIYIVLYLNCLEHYLY